MSIIDSKYSDRYRGPSDWVGEFIASQCTVSQEGKKKVQLDLDALFTLAEANHLDISKFEGQRDAKGAPGRLRMTIGNMLRAAARRRHGLNDLNGKFVESEDFEGEPVETPTGEKIVKEKAAA